MIKSLYETILYFVDGILYNILYYIQQYGIDYTNQGQN